MRRKLRRHLAFLMAVLMMLSLMGVQVLAEGVQVEAVQTTEGTDCTVLPEETDTYYLWVRQAHLDQFSFVEKEHDKRNDRRSGGRGAEGRAVF